MSKAFTREDDDTPDDPIALPQRPTLPPGARNYITPAGITRLRANLETLLQIERPKAAAIPDQPSSKRQLKIVDHHIRLLNESLEAAVVVNPPADQNTVRFGATVTVRNSRAEELSYRIVGVDETDLDQGWVSWLAPIAKALLNARNGQKVPFRFPAGEDTLEIIGITYE